MKRCVEALIGFLMFCGMIIGGFYLINWLAVLLINWTIVEKTYVHAYIPPKERTVVFSDPSFNKVTYWIETSDDIEEKLRMMETWDEIERMVFNNEESMRSPAIEVGSQAVIFTSWEWVKKVEREFSITQWFDKNSQQRYVYTGEECGVKYGMIFTVEEIRDDSLFVKLLKGDDKGQGTPCRSGVRFTAKKSDITPLGDLYSRMRGFTQPEQELATQLLDQNYYGKTMDVSGWLWVDSLNYRTCGIGSFDYGDGYVVEGGTVQVRGEASGRVLYEYTARGKPMRTACPSGILFFDES